VVKFIVEWGSGQSPHDRLVKTNDDWELDDGRKHDPKGLTHLRRVASVPKLVSPFAFVFGLDFLHSFDFCISCIDWVLSFVCSERVGDQAHHHGEHDDAGQNYSPGDHRSTAGHSSSVRMRQFTGFETCFQHNIISVTDSNRTTLQDERPLPVILGEGY